MSTEIAWLDRDTAAQEQVTRLLTPFEEPRTLDSLGLGVIRDALADELAPGVSTAQTRLRYFLFIPWIFERVAAESSSRRFSDRLRAAEVELIDRLAHLGSQQGVIGLRSRDALRVMPSALYWSGLGAWEIRKFDGSVRQAVASVSSASGLRVHTDDDGNRLETGPRLWCELPPTPDGFLECKECLDLSIVEAEWLVDRLRSAAATRDSLLRHAADYARRSGEAAKVQAWTTPWAMPDGLAVDTLNDRNRNALHHAQCVSEVTEGPRILYNIMLAEHASQSSGKHGNGAGGTADDAESKLKDWMTLLHNWAQCVSEPETAQRLAEWHRRLDNLDLSEGFWAYLEHLRGRPASRHLQQFVHAMAEQVSTSPRHFDNESNRRHIEHREHKLKGGRARLGQAAHASAPLKAWIDHGMPFTGGAFDFRWNQVASYLFDIANAGQPGSCAAVDDGRDR